MHIERLAAPKSKKKRHGGVRRNTSLEKMDDGLRKPSAAALSYLSSLTGLSKHYFDGYDKSQVWLMTQTMKEASLPIRDKLVNELVLRKPPQV